MRQGMFALSGAWAGVRVAASRRISGACRRREVGRFRAGGEVGFDVTALSRRCATVKDVPNFVAEIATRPIHLGLGATAEVEPDFNGEVSWYTSYVDRHATDGAEGPLVTMHGFTESWDMWEMHPQGSEVVLCVAGRLTFIRSTPTARPRSPRSKLANT